MKKITLTLGILQLLSIACGGILAFYFLNLAIGGAGTNFEDAKNFGMKTTSIFADDGNYQIHCSDSRDINQCIEGSRVRNYSNSVIWLGNSQLHAINQWKHGQTNSVPILFHQLHSTKFDLITLSQPNANLQEHLVLYEYLRQSIPVKALILPVVFDDTREDGIREDVARLMSDIKTKEAVLKSKLGGKIGTANQNYQNPDAISVDKSVVSSTIQSKVESILTEWLDDNWILWKKRPEARGKIFMKYLYVWRNKFFGITANTKRKIIRGRYHDNMLALEAILDSASRNNIVVFLYIAPIRSDVDIPYDPIEYEAFKVDVENLAIKFNSNFRNLEHLIPGNYWGEKGSISDSGVDEIDFMHFQSQGHKLLADELFKFLLANKNAIPGLK